MFFRYLFSASLVFVFLFQCSAAESLAVADKPDDRLEVKASETEQLRVLLANQKVNAALTDGTRVTGKVKEVRSGTIVIDVTASSGASALTRGSHDLATERFSTFEMTSYKGKKRGIFTAALGAAGLVLGLAIGSAEIDSLGGEGSINSAGAAVIAATTAGGAAAGYVIGRNLDKKRLIIAIVR
ncbi:MAG: hypothetical protein ABL999_16885 [Pyrinomonadaceae bacterium]